MGKNVLKMKEPIPIGECSELTMVSARPIDPRSLMNIHAGKCVVRIRTDLEFYRWVEYMSRLQHYSVDEISKGYATGWVFRGMESRKWHIVSSFHRHHGKSNANGIKSMEKRSYEGFIDKEHLKRSEFSTTLDMVSHIQHFGGYTRLIDFSMSFAVALHFAVRNSSKNVGAVWAVDCKGVRTAQRASEITSKWPGFKRAAAIARADNPSLILKKNRELANRILEGRYDRDDLCENGRVLWVSPTSRNERIKAQAGLFLMPTLLSKSFEEQLLDPFFERVYSKGDPLNLPETYHEMKRITADYRLIRFDFDKSVYGVARAFLHSVNVTDNTLRLEEAQCSGCANGISKEV